MRGKDAVIFIGSCCAVMISSHQYSHPVSDVAGTNQPQETLLAFLSEVD